MAIPPNTHACWQKLASVGLGRIKTDNLAVQLMAKRIERSADPIALRASEIHAFFAKFERLLPSEIAQLKNF